MRSPRRWKARWMHVGGALRLANRKSLGQVVIPIPAGGLRATGDRHGPQRQSARLCNHNGALCDRGCRIRAIDRLLRPTFHRRDICWTWSTVAGHASCGRPSGEMTRSALEVGAGITQPWPAIQPSATDAGTLISAAFAGTNETFRAAINRQGPRLGSFRAIDAKR